MPRRFDAVICDIDGCLGPETAEPVDAPRLARLAEHNRRARERADVPAITLCSGRPQPYAEAIGRVIGNDALPIVCENGVWLYDPRTNEYLRDPDISAAHMHAVHEATEWVERDLRPRGVVIQPGKTASISLWHPDTPYLTSLVPHIQATFTARAWPFRISMTVAWINCDLVHVSKATGLRRLIERTDLKKARLAGVGDSPSDLVMLEHVSYFACPINAAPEVKAKANYISPLTEIEGVLDILTHLTK